MITLKTAAKNRDFHKLALHVADQLSGMADNIQANTSSKKHITFKKALGIFMVEFNSLTELRIMVEEIKRENEREQKRINKVLTKTVPRTPAVQSPVLVPSHSGLTIVQPDSFNQ
jgi:hypothetical protein